MDLKLENQHFLVCGASSGFGNAVAQTLLEEGAHCVLTARRGDFLRKEFADRWPGRVEIIEGDLTGEETLDQVVRFFEERPLHGVLFNAGGPPTGTPLETTMQQWDEAYRLVMRWKVDLALRLAPRLVNQGYGRMVFIESKSVKQPIPLLVLSNAFRAGVVGFAKSLALDVAAGGVTVNVIAPGTHDTPAIERVIRKRSETEGISEEEARRASEASIPVGRMGRADELAALAAWLLSPLSGYVTGQTISHDGGEIAGLFG